MHYLGGKSRLAKNIVPTILSCCASGTGRYVEPFVGGGSILEAVCLADKFTKIYAGDLQEDLILMWQALQMGWQPPNEISEKLYISLKTAAPSPLRAFAAFACSFSGKWFNGYARSADGRNFAKDGSNVCLRKNAAFTKYKVRFSHKSYMDWKLEPGDVVYCDPPYVNTEAYGAHEEDFDHLSFWSWCRAQAENEVRIIVSESTPPPFDGWQQVWWVEREIQVTRQAGQRPGMIFDAMYVPNWLAGQGACCIAADW